MPGPDLESPHRLTDKAEIRRLLNTDRDWSLFALADLDDGLFEHCDWWTVPGALVLVFRAISIRPIFVLGDAAPVRRLLAALPDDSGYLNLKAGQLEAAEGIFRYRERHEMRRMVLDTFEPRMGETVALGPADCGEIERLYETGDGGGIAFAPFQLETGLFRGIRREGKLVGVAGVQVASRNEGVAAMRPIPCGSAPSGHRPCTGGRPLLRMSPGRVAGMGVHLCTGHMFEWDSSKALSNIRKHGVRFADAGAVFEDEQGLTITDDSGGERRWVTLGMGGFGQVLVVVYTWRGDRIRIISARRATPREQEQYLEQR